MQRCFRKHVNVPTVHDAEHASKDQYIRNTRNPASGFTRTTLNSSIPLHPRARLPPHLTPKPPRLESPQCEETIHLTPSFRYDIVLFGNRSACHANLLILCSAVPCVPCADHFLDCRCSAGTALQ